LFYFQDGCPKLGDCKCDIITVSTAKLAALNDLGYSDKGMMNRREFITKIKV
jgi:hypothetical protein